jgi:hypothetical protein
VNDRDAGTAPGRKRKRKMTILWIVIGIVVVLVLAPFIIGSLLPERYEGQTEAFLAQSPVDVWVALQNYESHPMTGKMMKSVEHFLGLNGLTICRRGWKTWVTVSKSQ